MVSPLELCMHDPNDCSIHKTTKTTKTTGVSLKRQEEFRQSLHSAKFLVHEYRGPDCSQELPAVRTVV